jgi:hypothetical protein
MTHEAGVRTVAMGGTPVPGEMQAASGNRGAALYDSERIDENFAYARQMNSVTNQTLPKRGGTGMRIQYAPINLRDQIRQKDKDSVPLQFQYLPANCRLYYTLANTYNMSRLWRDAAEATWENSKKCVSNSAIKATAAEPFSVADVPKNTSSVTSFRDWLSVPPDADLDTLGAGIQDGGGGFLDDPDVTQSDVAPVEFCVLNAASQARCKNGGQCTKYPLFCGGVQKSFSTCLSTCTSNLNCGSGTECKKVLVAETKQARFGRADWAGNPPKKYKGFCYPTRSTPAYGCPAPVGSLPPGSG